MTGYCSRFAKVLPSIRKLLLWMKLTRALAWSTKASASRVSGVSKAKGVTPVMMPADQPLRPLSLRVSQRCRGLSRKARKTAQAMEPAKGWSTSSKPYSTRAARAMKKAFV